MLSKAGPGLCVGAGGNGAAGNAPCPQSLPCSAAGRGEMFA